MDTDNSTLIEAEDVKAPVPGASALASVISDLGLTAGFAWVGGVALNHGFGVSVPFVATWLLLLAGLWLVQFVTGQLATVWHNARVKADITLIAATMAAQEAIQEQQDAKAFLSMNDRIKDMSAKVDGGYL